MKELNPLVLALNDIDTRYIVKPKRVKHIKTIKYASAAAAACLVLSSAAVAVAASSTGFNFRVITPAETPGVNVEIDNHTDHQFSYNITDKKNVKVLTKDELLEMGAVEQGDVENGIYSFLFEDALPSDILKLYNAEPITLGNDNFTEQPGNVCISSLGYNNGQCDYLNFDYELTHKKSGITLHFNCYVSIDGFDLTTTHETDEISKFNKETVILNDDTECLLLEQRMEDGDVSSTADFSYDGIIYIVNSLFNNMDMEQMKEVLADLGVL